MELTLADFDGFNPGAALACLRAFPAPTQQKGERYFRNGAVASLECHEPGRAYFAEVVGGDVYDVTLLFNRRWKAECTCPMGHPCKHIYAAFKQLLAEHTLAQVVTLSASAGHGPASSRPATLSAAQPPEPPPLTLAAMVQDKLGRSLTPDESRYLNNVHQLFRQAASCDMLYVNELAPFLPVPQERWWSRLELYPRRPRTVREFWNYLALYLTEQMNLPVPEFMQPVTELTQVREQMRRHVRARNIEHWRLQLSQWVETAHAPMAANPVAPVNFRARFLPQRLVFEWQVAGDDEWAEFKPRKAADFETRHALHLSAEAALLWLPLLQRCKSSSANVAGNFGYEEAWIGEQIGRWLRQPLLRPLLVDEAGAPLVFHEAPLHWQATEPDGSEGDYVFSLAQANGEPVPDLRLAAPGHPPVYLTSIGVFRGPPFEHSILSARNTTRIPAPAFESSGGLRLLDHLRVPPPPRLAARIRTVKLHPGIRAEVKIPWAGSETEYCFVEVYGASEDGTHVERWILDAWTPSMNSRGSAKDKDFIRLDRSALEGLLPPLEQAGFKWDYHTQRWQLRLTRKFAETFVTFLKALPPETSIHLAGDLASFQNAAVAGRIRLEASETDMDWFDLRVIVDVNDATLTPEEIKLLLDAKGRWVRLGDKGWRKLEFNLSEEEDRELARLGLTPHELTSEPQRMHALQLADKAARRFLPEDTCARIERRVTELQTRVTPDVPSGITAAMRPYQLDGFHFLAYLSANRFGGILADDMGLGKTLQTLAWLAWLRENDQHAKTKNQKPKTTAPPLPSLVVCPKSVADNWHAEAQRFLPGLTVKVWSPAELQELPERLTEADLHVINYSQLRSVGPALEPTRFLAVVLDEGQYIKNPSSITHLIARKLSAEHRLVLSGTPIENRLLDLWSLMNFAMPGALGGRGEFGRLYDAKGDPFARQRLAARVRPFLIRRTKAQVARDLPDRIEEDLYCELEGEQQTLYRAELKRAQSMLLGLKTAAALNKQRFHFLTSLLRLRQICCHPKLVKPDSKAASAKVEALIETLEPLMDEGEKVLVFSQFVELLDLLRGEIQRREWKSWYLAGDTENRGDLVREFQDAEGGGVFMISLKAGGFGLNLTASSYVILFDPWWNPAVENQAIDRTHRIGQARKVIAYRLLIKNSIEEKIRALQRRKKGLAEDVLGEEKFAQSLSLEDLRYLLSDAD